MTLSQSLQNAIHEAIKNATPPDLNWNYRDELSVEQINTILALPNGLDAVEREVIMSYSDAIDETEHYHITFILQQYKAQIQKELDDDSFGSAPSDWDSLIDEYGFKNSSRGVNVDIKSLVSNTRHPKVVLQLDLYHEYGGGWKEEINYKDVKRILRLFNINPRHIHKSFPYHGRRKGRPFINPKDLVEQWDNIGRYGGQYIIPIRLKLLQYIENINQYHTGIVIRKGSKIWLHNYGEGSGSIPITLQKNLKIMKKNLDYSFGDDREPIGHGMDEVHVLRDDAWNNYIKPVNVPNPTPYTLTPVEQLVKGLSYTSAFSQIHNRWTVRAYNNTAPTWGTELHKLGELMECDLRYMGKDFPESGKKYLRTHADKEVAHYAFQIRETIGGVLFVYGHIIVNAATGEIVWQHTKCDERTYELIGLVEQKLKQLHSAQKKAA